MWKCDNWNKQRTCLYAEFFDVQLYGGQQHDKDSIIFTVVKIEYEKFHNRWKQDDQWI